MNKPAPKILFITASRIGDAVLSTGLLSYIESNYPTAKVTIACGPLATTLFEGYPLLERIIPLKKEKHNRHWLKLWKQVIGTKWDIVIDLRDSAISRLIRADERHIFSKHIDKSQHKVQQNSQVMKLPTPPAPKLWFTTEQMEKAAQLIPNDTPIIGIGPTSNWTGKTWPTERFIEIALWLLNGTTRGESACKAVRDYKQEASRPVRPNGTIKNMASRPERPYGTIKIAVFGAPGEEEDAYKLYNAMPKDRRIDIIAKTDPGTAAATLARCDIYIGNDSGLMHCAAAAGIPTIGLFGPSYPNIYAPWGEHTTYAQTPETFDELINFKGYTPQTIDCLMGSLSVEMVKEVITEFMQKKP